MNAHRTIARVVAAGTAATVVLASESSLAQRAIDDGARVQRRAMIQAHFDSETPATQRWFWLWLAVPAASAVVQGTAAGVFAAPGLFAPAVVDNWLPGFVVGAITGAIGVIPQVALPFSPAFAAAELRRYRARDPRDGLGRAEFLLQDSAESEEIGRSWWVHLLGLGLAVGSSVATAGWMGWGLKPTVRENAWISAGVNLVISVAMSELTIFTQPTASVRAWRTYRSTGVLARSIPAPTLRAAFTGQGFALSGAF